MSINGGFTLGGQTARQLGMRMLRSSQRPILPGTVDRILGIAGRNGLYDFGADLGARQFNLECAIIRNTPVALQQAASDLAAYLVDPYGKPRTLELIFDYQPDRKYYVRYSGGGIDPERIAGLGRFTLPLIAFDPHAYADSNSNDVINYYDVGLEYSDQILSPNPSGFDWLHVEQHSSIYNPSTLQTGIEITITGSVDTSSIEHVQSGKALNLPNLTDGVMVIDTVGYKVKIDGNNAMPGVSGDFFAVTPGSNAFIFRCTSASARVDYNWRFKYL